MKRYEREIAELLEKLDEFIPDDRPRRPKRALGEKIRRLLRALTSRSASPTSLIIAAFVLAFLAYILREVFRPAAPYASIGSLVLFVAAIISYAIERRRTPEKRWRGRIIEIESRRKHSFADLSRHWRRFWHNLWRGPRNRY